MDNLVVDGDVEMMGQFMNVNMMDFQLSTEVAVLESQFLFMDAAHHAVLYSGDWLDLGSGQDLFINAGNNINVDAANDINTLANNDMRVDAGNDMKVSAVNDNKVDAGNDMTVGAGNDMTVDAGNDMTVDAGNDMASTAGANMTSTAGNDMAVGAGNDMAVDAGNDMTLSADNDIDMSASNGIEMSAGEEGILLEVEDEFGDQAIMTMTAQLVHLEGADMVIDQALAVGGAATIAGDVAISGGLDVDEATELDGLNVDLLTTMDDVNIEGTLNHIGNSNQQGNSTQVGDSDQQGNSFQMGNSVQNGNSTLVGDFDQQGNSTHTGNSIQIGNSTQVGDSDQQGNSTHTGNSTQVGDSDQTGNSTQVGDSDQTGNSSQEGDSYQDGNSVHDGDSEQTGNSIQTGDAVRNGDTDLNGSLDVEDETSLNTAGNDGTVFEIYNSMGAAAVTVETNDDALAIGGSATTLTTPRLIVQEDAVYNGDMSVGGSLAVTDNIISAAAPTSPNHMANKQYVDNAVLNAVYAPEAYSYDAIESVHPSDVIYYINGDLLLYASGQTDNYNYVIELTGSKLSDTYVGGAKLFARGNELDLFTSPTTDWEWGAGDSEASFKVGYNHISALAGSQIDGYVSCSLVLYDAAGNGHNTGLTLRFYLDSENPVATANTFNE
jgi:uncharacterized protein (DUF2345 family)